MESRKEILRRIYFLYFIVFLAGILIVVQLVRIQFVEGSKWRSQAQRLTTAYHNIEAVRGNIYASDGSLFATSLPLYEIRMDVNAGALSDEIFTAGVDSLSESLSKMFNDKSRAEYSRMFRSARSIGNRYLLIRRNVTYSQLKEMKRFPLFRLGKYKGGFIYEQRNKRVRPFQVLAARTIGYELEEAKPVGLEGAYNRYLSGIGGMRLMHKVSGGVWKPVNDGNEIEPQDGYDIYSTIDVNIQDVAENALLTQLSRHNADHGCVVLMEVQTGEVRAIANLSRDNQGNYFEYFNYAVGESTEPGSTFKIASIMAAMEDGYVEPEDSVDTDNGTTQYFDRTMRDSKKGGFGKITVQRAFEVSSNVGISKIIFENYAKRPQRFTDRLASMNLGAVCGIDIPGEIKPLIKNPKDNDWSGTTLPWMAIGYEVRLTPLQILTFYNAVANNGKMVKPVLVREIRRRGKVVEKFNPRILHPSIASRSTLEKIKKMLESVVENGSASNLKNPVYRIAGKTGTAQIANGKYGYKYKSEVLYQASFVGYFPADNPRYSCIVVVYAPSNDVYYGNLVAGPIFKEVSDKVYATSLNMHPPINDNPAAGKMPAIKSGHQDDIVTVLDRLDIPVEIKNKKSVWAVTTSTDSVVHLLSRKYEDDLNAGFIPDLTGINAEDALFLLENRGLHVQVKGAGSVRWQSLEPGTRIHKGKEIILELS